MSAKCLCSVMFVHVYFYSSVDLDSWLLHNVYAVQSNVSLVHWTVLNSLYNCSYTFFISCSSKFTSEPSKLKVIRPKTIWRSLDWLGSTLWECLLFTGRPPVVYACNELREEESPIQRDALSSRLYITSRAALQEVPFFPSSLSQWGRCSPH